MPEGAAEVAQLHRRGRSGYYYYYYYYYYYSLCAPVVENESLNTRFDTGLVGGRDLDDYPFGDCFDRDPAQRLLGFMTGRSR